MLFSQVRRRETFQIHPATRDDGAAVEGLLNYANRCYLALEWRRVQDFLGSPTLLLATDQRERPVGLLLADMGDGPVAWLRAVAVASHGCLGPLLAASAQAVLAQGGASLALLGGKDWILSELKSAGFRQINRVITLRHRGGWPMHHSPPGTRVRAATAADLDAVLAVDHAAFSTLWWYDREILQRALSVSACFHVAYLDDACVGYQFSTLRQGRGHIVRLAVHPHWQRRGIGGRLLGKTIISLNQAGAKSVTVNTQQDNGISLRLYRRFSFERTGASWAVWLRSLV